MVEDKFGTQRFYDPKTNTFGAYNRDGTTKTLFKPSDKIKYFERQIEKYGPKHGGQVINTISRSRGGGSGGGGGIVAPRNTFPFGFKPPVR